VMAVLARTGMGSACSSLSTRLLGSVLCRDERLSCLEEREGRREIAVGADIEGRRGADCSTVVGGSEVGRREGDEAKRLVLLDFCTPEPEKNLGARKKSSLEEPKARVLLFVGMFSDGREGL